MVRLTAWAHLDGTTRNFDDPESRMVEFPIITDNCVSHDEVYQSALFFLHAVSSSPTLPARGRSDHDIGFFKFFDDVERAAKEFVVECERQRATWLKEQQSASTPTPTDATSASGDHNASAVHVVDDVSVDADSSLGSPSPDDALSKLIAEAASKTAYRDALLATQSRHAASHVVDKCHSLQDAAAVVHVLADKFPRVADPLLLERASRVLPTLWASIGSMLVVAPVHRSYFNSTTRPMLMQCLTELVGPNAVDGRMVVVPHEVDLKREYESRVSTTIHPHLPRATAVTSGGMSSAVVNMDDFMRWMFSRMEIAVCLREYLDVCKRMGWPPCIRIATGWDATVHSVRHNAHTTVGCTWPLLPQLARFQYVHGHGPLVALTNDGHPAFVKYHLGPFVDRVTAYTEQHGGGENMAELCVVPSHVCMKREQRCLNRFIAH